MKSLRICAAVALACALVAGFNLTPFAQTEPAPVVQTVPTQAPQTQITTTAPVSSETTISVGTLGGQVLTWLAAAFSVPVGALLVKYLLKLGQLSGVQVTDAMKAQLQATIVNGLNASAASNAERLKGRGQLEVKNAIVADAVKYAQAHGAETIKALGLDPQSGEAVQAIKARIETAIADPGTPTPIVITPASQAKV
jgi:hypothetical protein